MSERTLKSSRSSVGSAAVRKQRLLEFIEKDYNWDANDLLCKLGTWQLGDISAQPAYDGNFVAVLNAIRAITIVSACNDEFEKFLDQAIRELLV